MIDMICLDEKYSRTRLLCKIVNDEYLILNGDKDNSKSNIRHSLLNQGGLRTKKYLEETMKSVVNQTYDNVEYNKEVHV